MKIHDVAKFVLYVSAMFMGFGSTMLGFTQLRALQILVVFLVGFVLYCAVARYE